MPEPKIYINVPMSDAQEQRIVREEHFWTAPRLVLLTVGTLAVALVVLYLMANVKSETYWDNWLLPAGIQHELEYEDR
jgi:hypothetical protein